MRMAPGATAALMTVGCKLNQYETEGIAELLEAAGFRIVAFDETADVYVVNTCTVTGRSDYRCRQMLRRAARTNPRALVVAAGCYAQRDPDTLASMPEVGLVVGQSSKSQIVGLIESALSCSDARSRPAPHDGSDGQPVRAIPDGTGPATGREAVVDVRPHSRGAFSSFDIDRFRGYTRAFLKIQDGCDRRCSYCAVPGARGPARSRRRSEVVRQAERLVGNGYSELVLTGVNIGAYGLDSGGERLPALLRELAVIDGLSRLRLGSVEPTELTPELAEEIATNDKVAKHLHVPMQSGSDRILSTMGRGYSAAGYASAVRRVTDASPLCGVGADVIVGFPGESDEDFLRTVSLVEELPLTYLHVFSFSPRPGTEAAAMEDDVAGLEKRRRSRTLRELGKRKSRSFRAGLVGTLQEVLIEEGSDRGDGRLSGLAGNYVRVEVEGTRDLCNRLLRVRIDGADDSRTWGSVVGGHRST